MIVKGIAGYGDLSQFSSASAEWVYFASTMAASLVASILTDPLILLGLPHFNEGKFTTEWAK